MALLAAGYSAFLFGQAEGRDFWQSPLLLPHLVLQALLAGSAVEVLVRWLAGEPTSSGGLLVLSSLNALFIVAEVFMPHGTRDARAAARWIVVGPLRSHFWRAVGVVGVAIPVIAALCGLTIAPAVAVLAGLLAWEWIWVEAGQAIPLS